MWKKIKVFFKAMYEFFMNYNRTNHKQLYAANENEMLFFREFNTPFKYFSHHRSPLQVSKMTWDFQRVRKNTYVNYSEGYMIVAIDTHYYADQTVESEVILEWVCYALESNVFEELVDDYKCDPFGYILNEEKIIPFNVPAGINDEVEAKFAERVIEFLLEGKKEIFVYSKNPQKAYMAIARAIKTLIVYNTKPGQMIVLGRQYVPPVLVCIDRKMNNTNYPGTVVTIWTNKSKCTAPIDLELNNDTDADNQSITTTSSTTRAADNRKRSIARGHEGRDPEPDKSWDGNGGRRTPFGDYKRNGDDPSS
jgi:hypothetical protein